MSNECHCSCHLNQQSAYCQSCNPDKQSWEKRFKENFVKGGKGLKKYLGFMGYTSCPICGADPDIMIPYIRKFIEKEKALSYSQGRQKAIEDTRREIHRALTLDFLPTNNLGDVWNEIRDFILEMELD